LMQKAFSKDAYVADAKVQISNESRVRLSSRFEARGYDQQSR
jgi:hypothetical protein